MAHSTYRRGPATAALCCATALTLALTGCSAGGDDADSSKPAGRDASSAASPHVEPAAYRSDLKAALGPLEKALTRVNATDDAKELRRRLQQAAERADRAARAVGMVRAPAKAAEPQEELTEALRSLGDDLRDARGKGGACGAAPRAALHTAEGPERIGEVLRSLGELGYPMSLPQVRTEPAKDRRLANGAFVRGGPGGGMGKLTLQNAAEADAAITFARGRSPLFTLYLRKGKSAQVNNVANGSYTVYFTTGADWNAQQQGFTRQCTLEKFDDKANFTTRSVQGGTQYSVLTLSLEKSASGNETTSNVPEDEYPG